LFGHTRGAFTGADRDREGLLLAAGEGTVFLDEIGELPLTLQAKLLRVIENREVLPVGAVRPTMMKAQLLAATNKNLENEVAQSRFRADLYYRLNVVSVKMPPLAARRDDIPEIATALLQRQCLKLGRDLRGFEPDAMLELQKSDWPGNVRELDNTIQRASILAEGPWLTLNDLQTSSAHNPARPQNPDTLQPLMAAGLVCGEMATTDLRDAVRIYERAHISRVLADCGDDRKQAAARLGLGLSSLYAKIRELGISG
ncbi:MAG: sigma 54-interacting transcriptional regulator, partial [Isosphaeraceae bacterium]